MPQLLESRTENANQELLQQRHQQLEHFSNISCINGSSGSEPYEKENDSNRFHSGMDVTHRKNCLVKLGKKAMR